MRNKLFILLITSSIIFSSCGNKSDTSSSSTQNTKTTSSANTEKPQDTPSASTEEPQDTPSDDLDAIGDVEVEKNLFNVKFKVPAEFMGETTQKELDKVAKESGYKSIKLNKDGSATYIMTKAQHEKLMQEMTKNANEQLEKMIASEDYPNFTDIKANDDFTSFEITTKSKKLDLSETMSSLAFYMLGGMYNIFNGKEADNIHLDYINAKTGKIIESYDSNEIQ
ncbi:MAG: hypothetical protein K1W06_00430 [Lachnospiraceae bacterium]